MTEETKAEKTMFGLTFQHSTVGDDIREIRLRTGMPNLSALVTYCIARGKGSIIPRERIADFVEIHRGYVTDIRNIDSAVKRARKALRDREAEWHIATWYGEGYQMLPGPQSKMRKDYVQ